MLKKHKRNLSTFDRRDAVIDLAEDGDLSWEDIARAALEYMSPAQVADLAHSEGWLDDETTEDSDSWG